MKVLHIITGLNSGGAEAMLAKLVTHPALGRGGVRHEVLSLLPAGPVADRIRAAGVTVESLGMRRGMPGPMSVARLVSRVRRARPSLLQGWMYHGNLAATAARGMAAQGSSLLWNIRHSVADMRREPPMTQRIIRFSARLSDRPDAIIYNSQAASGQHEALGYSAERGCVIANGFDCDQFAPDPAAAARLRKLFHIHGKPIVVAMVARAHPMKSVDVMVEAARLVRSHGHDIHLLLVGNGMDRPTPEIAAILQAGFPPNRVTLSGERQDVAHWLPGVDILALSSSWGEGFPNILGEAMACAVPCVTTDVGDARQVVDNTGLVVPPGDPEAMAHAIGRLVRLGAAGRLMLGHAARNRVIANYSLDQIADQYANLYLRHARAEAGRDAESARVPSRFETMF